MRSLLFFRSFNVLLLAVIVGCDTVPTERVPEALGGADAQNQIGWIWSRSGTPIQVIYDVYKGHAIWQGDIDLGPAHLIAKTREELQARRGPQLGAVIDGSDYRWPNGRVPYVVDASLQPRVDSAITHTEARIRGVNFVPWTSEWSFVNIVPDDVCQSAVGRVGGPQTLRLAPGCNFAAAMHELGHALGLFHEHTRCDRDNFVEILWGNIRPGEEDNFYIQCDDATDYFWYDEGSVMHYGPTDFGINNAQTIRSKRGLEHLMGQRDSLGPTDVKTIRNIYPYWLVAGISGDQFLFGDPAEYAWSAGAGGGTAPYTFTWWIDRTDPYGDIWDRVPEGDGSSTLTMYVDKCDGNFALQVQVTDSDPYGSYYGETAPFVIENWITSPPSC